MSVYEKLMQIQKTIKVPKTRKNDFGNFNFRNAEDIYKAFKKMEEQYRVLLVLNDEVISVNGCSYIKATATLIDTETGESIAASANAKEPQAAKAKMDESQTSGSASSYARKYALSGLFLLDDSVDVDSNQYIDTGEPATDAQVKIITDLCVKHNVNQAELYKKHKVKGRPTGAQAGVILNIFKKNFGDD